MFTKSKKGGETRNEDRVELAPFMGIRPGVYLALLYSLVLALVLFFVLFFPGLSKPGSVLRIHTEPQGAAVRIDGVYQGASPLELFVPKGRHTVSLVLPAFSVNEFELNAGGRVFGSLFFPKRISVSKNLETSDPAGVLSLAAADYARWAAVGEPSAIYQIPLSLSEGAYRAGGAAESGDYQTMNAILGASARFARNRAQIRDLVRAKFLTNNRGIGPSPLSLVNSARDMLNYLSDNPGASFWLSGSVYGGGENTISASSWHKGHTGLRAPPEQGSGPGAAMRHRGIEFRSIPEGSLNRAPPYAARTPVSSFWIAASEISREDWNRFTNENPRWALENRPALVAEGLVTEDYLADPPELVSQDLPVEAAVTGVSWYAAKAFCAWLDESLPGYTVRLPTELEWEYAARVNSRPGGRSFGSMLLKHWEWCEDSYSYLDYLPRGAMELIDAPERPVRGGSWLNTPETITAGTRGGLSPETCSPFVSFRPLLVREGA
ncbi:MAG: SUMF1/EgtB/PvdO family nonheme iron enzyme [Spirochaetaceae bacterium]|nr:SUMF1/EgtB/PvdO family nonheme iron enzyme [Spirochaetaceae bacterium]